MAKSPVIVPAEIPAMAGFACRRMGNDKFICSSGKFKQYIIHSKIDFRAQQFF